MGLWFPLAVLTLIATAFAAAAETVRFASDPPFGPSLTLSAELSKPAGDGPFPAVVMLHGCSGPWDPWGGVWAERLVAWGYVALRVDSFGPRGFPDGICDRIDSVVESASAEDSHAAKTYLKTLPYVDAARVAVFGMSHGGRAALLAVHNSYLFEAPRSAPFQAAIAPYPYCPEKLYRLDAPLLILAAEADDWTPAMLCSRMAILDTIGQDIVLKVYPDATHAFDVDQPERTYLGHFMRYDAEATRDAITRVRDFLARHLGPQ